MKAIIDRFEGNFSVCEKEDEEETNARLEEICKAAEIS
jgi:hypothetical protein